MEDTRDVASSHIERHMFPTINHYYGDTARRLMLAGALLMVTGAPFYSDNLRAEIPLEIIAALAIVASAALTNPFKKVVIAADTILSVLAASIFAIWALFGYDTIPTVAFILRDAIALIFLAAFYFSLKTLRAMILHQVGKPDTPAEFRRTSPAQSFGGVIADDAHLAHDPLRREKHKVEQMMRKDKGD